MTKTLTKKIQTPKTIVTNKLVLYNDDYNTFDWVIECLLKYCNHSTIQAEQCALIVHTSGKCIVKEGIKIKLNPICQALCEAGLHAKII